MQKEVEPEKVTLHVARVEFDSKSGIPLELQREIGTSVLGATFEEDADTDYLKEAANEIAEVGVREPLQNKGYFRLFPDAKLTALKAEGSDMQVAAVISPELGPQYWLGAIQFEPANPDYHLLQPRKILRDLMPLKTGDLFNEDGLRAGLSNLTRFYNRKAIST